MKSFPTIWFQGNEAGFYLDDHLVRVPLRFGSNHKSLHVIPWLYRYFPFYVRSRGGRCWLAKKIDGKEVQLHKIYARLLHGEGDFVVSAENGNLLHWTSANIGARRKPHKIVPAGSQESEVKKQMLLRKQEGSISYYVREHARLLGKLGGVLTSEELTAAKTESVLTAERWERELAARRTRGDADADRQQAKEDQPHPDYEKLTPESDTRLIAKCAVTSSNHDSENDDADNFEGWVPDAVIQDITFEDFRASLNPARWEAGTEKVLQRHGWRTPRNQHRPRYIGKRRKVGRVQ